MTAGAWPGGLPPSVIDAAVALALVLGIALFRTPVRARAGNLLAAGALAVATALVLVRHGTTSPAVVAAGAGVGGAAGWVLARLVHMIHIPPMVSLQNGMGGLAALLVSCVQLTGTPREALSPTAIGAAALGLFVGAATCSGSMIASGKLANWLRQTPVELPGHGLVLAGLAAGGLGAATAMGVAAPGPTLPLLAGSALALSLAAGVALSMRIGGADMPVLISFLNAMSGLAASLCGLTFGNRLLIICGATVAASGLVLTQAMCRAMNRSLGDILAGRQVAATAAPAAVTLSRNASAASADVPLPAAAPGAESGNPIERSLDLLRCARRVIIVPGYGMALADAQQEVVRLADRLAELDKEVVFAIHPVAGRMPGHMHVLLAEAGVDYRMIRELDEVNDVFTGTDVALVVGACDVVNPAAIASSGTPISGMPILKAHEARHAVVCNLDDRPGYSGVENPLYRAPGTVLLLGDARDTVDRLVRGLS